MTVEIKNGTSKIFDPLLTSLSMSYGARGNQAESIYDSAHGVGSGFTTKLPPGRIGSAIFAFSIPPADLDDLILQISPDFEHDSELFEGSAK